jgi:hypothetical protein
VNPRLSTGHACPGCSLGQSPREVLHKCTTDGVRMSAGVLMTPEEVEKAAALCGAAGAWLVLDNTCEPCQHHACWSCRHAAVPSCCFGCFDAQPSLSGRAQKPASAPLVQQSCAMPATKSLPCLCTPPPTPGPLAADEHFVYGEGRRHHCVAAPHVINIFSFSKVGAGWGGQKCHTDSRHCFKCHIVPGHTAPRPAFICTCPAVAGSRVSSTVPIICTALVPNSTSVPANALLPPLSAGVWHDGVARGLHRVPAGRRGFRPGRAAAQGAGHDTGVPHTDQVRQRSARMSPTYVGYCRLHDAAQTGASPHVSCAFKHPCFLRSCQRCVVCMSERRCFACEPLLPCCCSQYVALGAVEAGRQWVADQVGPGCFENHYSDRSVTQATWCVVPPVRWRAELSCT